MELQPHPTKPEASLVTFDNYREFMELRAFSLEAFTGWALRGLHLHPPMQFPHTETIGNDRLEKRASQLRNDAQYVLAKGHPNASEMSHFRVGLAEQIEAQFEPLT